MSNYDYSYPDFFTVPVMLVNNFIISSLSSLIDEYSSSVRLSAEYSLPSQNFVSLASFKAIVNFVKKSALLWAY